jgi:four helix bundle protein
MFGLTSQFCRASDSIVLNLAEGASCSSKREFAKFVGYPTRSGYECGGCEDIAASLVYISKDEYEKLLDETNQIVAMLIGLQRSLQKWVKGICLLLLPTYILSTYYFPLETNANRNWT